MGVADPKGKDIIRNPVFACDLLNGSICRGTQYFEPQRLEILPESSHILYRDGTGREQYEEQVPDALFVYHDSSGDLFITIQNQKYMSLVMPVRELLSSAILYKRQLARMRSGRRREPLKKGAEFLSGVKEGELLSPVINIVLYYGEKPWTGALQLQQMLNFPDNFPRLRELCPDFKINLIHCGNVDPNHFRTGFRKLFELLPHAADKKALEAYVSQHPERFSNLNDNDCRLLDAFMGTDILNMISQKERRKSGGVNMWTALKEIREDGRLEGRLEGRGEGRGDILSLIAFMTNNPEDAGKITLLPNNEKLQKEMLEKYHIQSDRRSL